MMQMNEMCKRITPFKCKKCGGDMLFFETKNKVLIDYKELLGHGNGLPEVKHYLENKNVTYLKCISCDRYFIIDWTSGYPTQLTDREALNKFGV